MDLAAITDIKELKALAYDQLLLQQQAENNLRLINQRLEQLTAEAEQAAQKSGRKGE